MLAYNRTQSEGFMLIRLLCGRVPKIRLQVTLLTFQYCRWLDQVKCFADVNILLTSVMIFFIPPTFETDLYLLRNLFYYYCSLFLVLAGEAIDGESAVP